MMINSRRGPSHWPLLARGKQHGVTHEKTVPRLAPKTDVGVLLGDSVGVREVWISVNARRRPAPSIAFGRSSAGNHHMEQMRMRIHSALSAAMGLMRVMRRAGRYPAQMAVRPRIAET